MGTIAAPPRVNPNKPLSPHLTIYKFGDNMIMSTVFRGTGIFMTAGVGLLSSAYIFSGKDLKHYIALLQEYPFLNALVKFGVFFPLTFHYLGGLRHLAWDNVYGQNKEWVKKTGFGAAGAAGLVGAVAMFTTLKKKNSKKHD
jgi:succinate dehydrogenase / fumarate reductase, cytochrome b subunit